MVQIEPHFSYVRSTRGHLKGNITVPGSKSCTIRAVMLGMLADGITTIHNPLASRDGISALRAAKLLGATVSADQKNHIWTIQGLSGVPKVPDDVIDTLNSGTTTSFTTGICTLLTNGYAVITGDEQIRNRPWRHETDALKELGATCIHTRGKNDSPPLVISGPIHGGKCHLPGFNSQHVSGVLVPAALLPEGESIHIEVADPLETPYVQMTIDWMKKFGAEVDVSADYKHYYIKGGQSYHACNCTIPSDWSSVAFPLVAAVCTPSEVVISGVKFDDVQGDKIVVDLLLEMGADIEKDTDQGKLIIHGGKPLHGITIDMNAIPDSLPALSVAAAYAQGTTHFTNLAHVRVKETDRVAVIQENLTACGGKVDITESTMTVYGGRPLHGTIVNGHHDHRIVMAMTILGLLADGMMQVDDPECAEVSFPGFYTLMNQLDAGFELLEGED